MAKVYGGFEGVKEPEFTIDYETYQKEEEAYIETIKKLCKEQSKCPHAGEMIHFPIADGRACYIVLDYRTLIHLGIGDCYSIPDAHARGLRKADIIEKINQQKALAELFSNRS